MRFFVFTRRERSRRDESFNRAMTYLPNLNRGDLTSSHLPFKSLASLHIKQFLTGIQLDESFYQGRVLLNIRIELMIP